MVLKTYRRQGAFLHGKQIEMPTPEKKAPNIWGEMLDNVSKVTAKLSEQNYALGRAELINGVLETAYNEAPDNPKRFNELIKSGFENGLNGLSEETKNDIYSLANDKVKMLQIKVGNNLNKRLDAENTQKITNLAHDALYGSGGLMELNKSIADYVKLNDDPNGLQALIDQRNKVSARLKTYANAKNMRGGYVIGSSKMRMAMNNPSLGMYDSITESLEDLDLNGLKEYDSKKFQNLEYRKVLGLSKSDYSKLDKFIAQSRKRLDNKDKREIREQSYFNAVNYAYTEDPDTLTEIKDQIGKDNYEALSKFTGFEEKKDFSPVFFTDKDEDQLIQFNKITKVLGSRNDGSEEYEDDLLKTVIEAKRGLVDYAQKYGKSKEDIEIMTKVMVDSAVNEEYAKALTMFTDKETAIGREISKYKEELKESDFLSAGQALKGLSLTTKRRRAKVEADEVRKEASAYLRQAVDLGSTSFNIENPEQLQTAWEKVRKIRDEGNKAVIRASLSKELGEYEVARLDSEYNEGKRPLFEKNGQVFEFLGYSKNGIFYREVLK